MRCDDIDPQIEGFADGTSELDADARSHLQSCARCAAALAHARAIHELLASREAPVPSPSFTAGVMARVGRDRWQTERVIDLGFNLALAAGVMFILVGGAGLAWSLGFLTITIDVDAILQAAGNELAGRVVSQVQTIGMAAALLTMALGLWWWAEVDSSL